MNITFDIYAKREQWMLIILPEIGIFRDYGEYGFEICWLCFCLQITNK